MNSFAHDFLLILLFISIGLIVGFIWGKKFGSRKGEKAGIIQGLLKLRQHAYQTGSCPICAQSVSHQQHIG